MAQISNINYSDILEAQRFDAEYFKPEYLDLDKVMHKLGYHLLGNFAFITDGIHESIDFDDKSDIVLVSAKAPKENYFDLSGLKFISKNQHDKNPRTALREDDVIISTVGTIGNCAVVNKNMLPANSDRHVGIIRPKENLSSYFLSTFLLSKYGKLQTYRYRAGNVQPNLYIKDLKKIKLPVLKNFLQDEISNIVKKALLLREKTKDYYSEAEHLLLLELGLLTYKSEHKITFETTSQKISHASRFDAEYFQPKYEVIVEHIENYHNGFDSVKNIIDFNNTNYKPDENKVYRYIALADISSQGYIESYDVKLGKELPSRARRKVKTNDVIISSIEGSLSSCAIVEEEHNDYLCSTGFYIMRSKVLTPEVLLVLFKTDIIQSLLKRGSNGTILAAITKAEIEQLKLPLIDKKVQVKISEKIKKSALLRKESKYLLELAKKSVEVAIEEGEEKALKLIEKEIKEYV